MLEDEARESDRAAQRERADVEAAIPEALDLAADPIRRSG